MAKTPAKRAGKKPAATAAKKSATKSATKPAAKAAKSAKPSVRSASKPAARPAPPANKASATRSATKASKAAAKSAKPAPKPANKSAANPMTRSDAQPTQPTIGTVAESWARIDRWFAAHPQFDPKLRPGASEADIAAAEAKLDLRFPDDFRESLLIHDGQDDAPNCQWIPIAYRLGSLASLVACWTDDRVFWKANEHDVRVDSLEDGDRIRVAHYHPRQIPFAGSPLWDYDRLLLDLAPGPKGTGGQVIARQDIALSVHAPSYRAFLDQVAHRLEADPNAVVAAI